MSSPLFRTLSVATIVCAASCAEAQSQTASSELRKSTSPIAARITPPIRCAAASDLCAWKRIPGSGSPMWYDGFEAPPVRVPRAPAGP